ncbi:hypothetical protein [Cochleicola gelatinilyticus]|nr:hypothetical protein [Cochleicola gelatinilyticus]
MNFSRNYLLCFFSLFMFANATGQSPTLAQFLDNPLSRASYEKDKTLLITVNGTQPNIFKELYTFEEFIEDVIDVEHPEAYDEDNLDAYYDFFNKWFDKNYHRFRVCSLNDSDCTTTTSLAGFIAFYPFLTHNRPSNSRLEEIDNEERSEKSIKVLMELKTNFFDYSPIATSDLYAVTMAASNLYSDSDIELTMMGYYGYYLTFQPESTNFLTLYNRLYREESKSEFDTGRNLALKKLSSNEITDEYFYQGITNGNSPIYSLAYKDGSHLEHIIKVLTPGFTSNKYQIKNTHYKNEGAKIRVTEYDYVEFSKSDFDKMYTVYLNNSNNGLSKYSEKIPAKSIFDGYLNSGNILDTYTIVANGTYKYCVDKIYRKTDFDVIRNFNYGAQGYANDFSSLNNLEVYVENCEPKKIIVENKNGLKRTLKITDFKYDITWNNPGLTEEQKNELRRKLGYPVKD